MKTKLISILLCMCTTVIFFSGCANNEISSSSQLDSAITEDGSEEQSEEAPQQSDIVAEDIVTQTPFDALTDEEKLQRVVDNYNILVMKGYTRYHGRDWSAVDLDETVQIDTFNHVVTVEKVNNETGSNDLYYLTNEDGNDYMYVVNPAYTDGYARITGHDTLTYSNYTTELFIPNESSAGYEIQDYKLKVSEPYEYVDGRSVLDVVVSYNQIVTDPATGASVELDVDDTLTVTADTQQLVMRIFETEDETNEESVFNSVEEIYYVTGEEAVSLSGALPGFVYELEAISYETYMGL